MMRPSQAAMAAFALAAVLAGCGTSTTVLGGNDTYAATTLTVYSDLPLLGPNGAAMTTIVNGEILALYDHGGHVGPLHISLESLNDYADPGVSDPLLPDPLRSPRLAIAQSAHTASSDLSTAAYIGDYDSAETAISLQLNNQNDILQVSPDSPYVGLTDSSPADAPGDPGIFYPYGTRTFARLVPSDAVEAQAAVTWMRQLGVHRLAVLTDNSNPPYDAAIALLVATDAPGSGVTVTGLHRGVDTQSATSPRSYARLAAAIAAGHPQAVYLGGEADAGAPALWRALHLRLPHAKLFAPSTLATPAFLDALGSAASATYVTSPILEPGQYPPAAQRVFAAYRHLFHHPASAYALYGYDAMNDVLAAIAKAGREAASRPALLAAWHSLGEIRGTIGSYRFNDHGDISITRIDGYRVGAGGTLEHGTAIG
jgi:ABC-type branched-subunit amino acid transport system substrate-binding protein